MYTVLKFIRPFEGNCKGDMAPGENEFDTPALDPPSPHRLFCENSKRGTNVNTLQKAGTGAPEGLTRWV